MERLTKCDICSYRDHEKNRTPCSVCSDNKLYISHYKEDDIVSILREHWGIKEEKTFVNADEEVS